MTLKHFTRDKEKDSGRTGLFRAGVSKGERRLYSPTTIIKATYYICPWEIKLVEDSL
jgi:hypothetical protein